MNILELEKILVITGNSILILNGILALAYLINKPLKTKNINLVFRWSLFAFLLGLFELFLMKFVFINDPFFIANIKPITRPLGIIDYSFISSISYIFKFYFFGMFFSLIFANKIDQRIFIFLTWGLLLFEIIMIFYFKSYQSYDSLSSTVKNIFILSGSGLLLYRIHKAEISNISLYKNTYFWIGFALFITALTEIFLEFIFSQLQDSDLVSFYKLYLVRNAFQVAFFIMMIVAFLNTKYLRFLPEKY